MNKYLKLLNDQKIHLVKAIAHLEYSYQKLNKIDKRIDDSDLDDELLEIWESFSARFSRVIDLFLSRYLRSYILYNDPGFKGSLRDHINCGEKLGLIDDANWWLELRELRNITAHEYNDIDLYHFYQRIFSKCETLINLKIKLQQTPCV